MKMNFEVMENSGFCFGVKRAVEMAEKAAEKYAKVVTLGPIIHNPQIVEHLREKGLRVVNSIDEIKDEAVIIRSHGITYDDYLKLKKMNIQIIDATCPIVKKAQKYAQKLTGDGYHLVVLGDENHPEVEALLSYTDDNCKVISEIDIELDGKSDKVGLIAQTTQTESKFEKLAYNLVAQTYELRVFRTICNATKLRQEKTDILAKKADLMLVVGGRNSANTTHLSEISRGNDCETYHIETAAEIKDVWLENKNYIGITAGASTPDWIINKVKNKIKEYKENEDKKQLM